MKMYMAYSNISGCSEGAVLVFANTVKEAKPLAFYNSYIGDLCDNEWIDLRVRLIKGEDYLMKEKLKDIPHVVDCPKACDSCNCWGNSEIGEDGLCDYCREDEDV